jgi:hypothetical protein
MEKHKNIGQLVFMGLTEKNSFFVANLLSITFNVTVLSYFCVTSVCNIQRVNNCHSNFNVSSNCCDEEHGVENV